MAFRWRRQGGRRTTSSVLTMGAKTFEVCIAPSYVVLEPRMAFDAAATAAVDQALDAVAGNGASHDAASSSSHSDLSLLSSAISNLPAAVTRAMNARQYILNAVNGIPDMDPQASPRGDADLVSERAEQISYNHTARSQGRATSDGLKGFALRTVYGSGGEEMIVETLLGRDHLYLNFTGIDRGASNAAAEWTVVLADGRPLPNWIKRDSTRAVSLLKFPPASSCLISRLSRPFRAVPPSNAIFPST